MNKEKIIKIGHSPDADDAFMFYGLVNNKVKLDGIKIEFILEDIQSLNERAKKGELEVTAISAHAYPYIQDKYWIMSAGASMGEGYGPILISKDFSSLEELKGKKIATPGKLTTASLLFKIFFPDYENADIPFDQIMERVKNGEYAAGLLIHEGQLTYANMDFNKILDLGTLWKTKFGNLPLPLGLDIIRKDLGNGLAKKITNALKQSIKYAYDNQQEAIPYALGYGRGLDFKLGEKFVKMYVNELTIDMGQKGKKALEELFKLAYEHKLIPYVEELTII